MKGLAREQPLATSVALAAPGCMGSTCYGILPRDKAFAHILKNDIKASVARLRV